jgi:flagellar protein FlaG
MDVELRPASPSADPSSGRAKAAARRAIEAERSERRKEARDDAPRTERGRDELFKRLGVAGPNFDARLSIVQDDVTRDFVYRILNTQTGEVVRQFPKEEMLELLRFLSEKQGLVVDRQV